MKAFILKLLLFSFVLFILDRSFLLFRVSEKNMFAEIAEKKMETVAKKNTYSKSDLIIMGSSHAQFAVSPEIIQDQCKIASANLAYGGGGNTGLQLSLLNKLLMNINGVKPKFIVLALDVFALNIEPVYNDKCQRILFGEKDNILDYLNTDVLISYFKLYSRFIPHYYKQTKSGDWTLPYYKTFSYDLSMFTTYNRYEITENGWVKGYGSLNKKYVRYKDVLFNPNVSATIDFTKYISLCKKNNIKLILIQLPEHACSLSYSQKYIDFNKWINKIATNNNLSYYNYNTPKVFPVDEDSLFFDTDHLNKKGAEIFSKILSNDINKSINF